MQHRINSGSAPKSCTNLVNIGTVVFELMWDRSDHYAATRPQVDDRRLAHWSLETEWNIAILITAG